MRVIATLTIGVIETIIEGDTDIFTQVSHERWLNSIGFWLSNWRYCQAHAKPHKKSRVFVPWTSCFMVEELTEKL